MSQQLVSLCAVLIEESCGHLSSQIFTAVSQHGNANRVAIGETIGVDARKLKAPLAVLCQQHLLLYYTNDDGQTSYQIDARSAYQILRFHRMTDLARSRHGESAARVISHLHLLGQATVGSLIKALSRDSKDKRSGAAYSNSNGQAEAGTKRSADTNGGKHIKNNEVGAGGNDVEHARLLREAQLHSLLRTLLNTGFLVKTGKRDFTPAADLEDEIMGAASSDFTNKKPTGTKAQAEYAQQLEACKQRYQFEEDYNDARDTLSDNTTKRPAKRIKLAGAAVTGTAQYQDHTSAGQMDGLGPKLQLDMALRVNFAKCRQCLRNNYLEQLATRYLGDTTAAVYKALLQVLEGKTRVRYYNFPLDGNAEDLEREAAAVASIVEISEMLGPSIDLTSTLLDASDAKAKSKKTEGFSDIGIKPEGDASDAEGDQPINSYTTYEERQKRMSLVEDHLRLLEEHPKAFCRRTNAGGRSDWQVNFVSLAKTIVQAEIDATVTARFGEVHARIVRMLRAKGKLEEKQVAAFTMMRIKDVRSLLTELQFAGFVEPQEVPKDSHRQSSRTIYLWNHEHDRVRKLIEQQTYTSIAHTLERLQREKVVYRAATEKAELMKSRQEALSQHDRAFIQQWLDVQEKLLTQVQRMDELIAAIY